MIFGMTSFTFIHVLISLIGIISGLIVLAGLLASDRKDGWTLIFLVTTAATSLTGFGFPYQGFTPAIGVGILSIIILIIAAAARYPLRLAGAWRWIYVITALIALYLNVFVLVAQSFQKIPALNALAPTGSEPPFAIAQGVVLLLFIAAGFACLRRFHPAMR
ncbi:hypothetical protein DEV92_111156 [Phyllobacterium myrsinacearum]|uniref:Uncharacterized protein n=2 Tax=Phyllobacterium myrsinacearum TaxID=28101 RepID=A0A2S9JDK0_9HYPH|nr:hypothetical protein C5750_19085 [Phyllobacterium myrsinacearum]PWV88347.1 hypothetical protein DEV92_111156 [Phyllobacterium myrsinacearum]RZS88790.1 hypothetical protein EV217_1179 [Phyllobacterium myrsinacearum]RZU97638.1 hypothetical protein EV654_4500 [Phyllobacterium myrsinacearum]